MEYKRLTFRHKSVDGTEQIGYTEKLVGCYRKEEMILNRLAELEDKIEQGTLIDLPCKVGDTVYWVWEEYTNGKQKLSIEEWEVEKICIEKNEWAVKGLGEELVEGVRQFFWCHSSRFGIWWFLTREEAEKRLKELQNG